MTRGEELVEITCVIDYESYMYHWDMPSVTCDDIIILV
jgi:hypothetical protein